LENFFKLLFYSTIGVFSVKTEREKRLVAEIKVDDELLYASDCPRVEIC